MIRLTTLALVLALPAAAQDEGDDAQALMDALQLDRMVSLMHAEGTAQAEGMADELFPGRGTAGWQVSVGRIYDRGAMGQRLRDAFGEALDGRDVAAMAAFFASERGRRIVDLELAAREALADEDVEETARAAWGLMPSEDPERHADIQRFVAVNDLIDENVEAAFNANLEFLGGLDAGGAFPDPMPEEEMLAQVWNSEPRVRAEMEEWLGAFLTLAYEPLTDADLDAYIAFSDSEVGEDLNRALFAGFDAMYEGVGYQLGRAAAAQMVGQDL